MSKNKCFSREITMILKQTVRPNYIAFYTGKHKALFAEVGALASVFENLNTELKPNLDVNIETFYGRTSNVVKQLPELIKYIAEFTIDNICVQKHTCYYSKQGVKFHDATNGWIFFSLSAWKKSVNAAVDVWMFLSPRALTSLNSIEKSIENYARNI